MASKNEMVTVGPENHPLNSDLLAQADPADQTVHEWKHNVMIAGKVIAGTYKGHIKGGKKHGR